MKKILIKLLTLLAFFASSITALTTTAFADQYPDLCPLLNRTMKIGTQGPDVKRLQVVLGQEGIAYLSATGYYGTVTSKAVKTFQLRNGITSTGNVGPITLARMRSLWCTDYYTNGGSNVPDSGYYQPTPTTVAF
jgi:peptidoglycan hydrolase-like protein with peptidoglycan-binding domain